MVSNPFVALVAIFIGILATMQVELSPILNSTQVGAAGTDKTSGSCQRTYVQCMNNRKQANKSLCESTWSACVKKKCVVKTLGIIKQCPRDSDCETSCTEYATSEGGLRNCCLIEPSHTLPACRKLIDDICNPGTPNSYVNGAGQVFTEGETIPPKQPMGGTQGDAMVIGPTLTYPEGTIIDKGGMATKLPDADPMFPSKEIHPYTFAFPNESSKQLPPEYQPDKPYEVPRSLKSYNEVLSFSNAHLSTNGAAPPTGLNQNIFEPEVMGPPTRSFDNDFRAEPNKLSLVSPVIRPDAAAPSNTFSPVPVSAQATLSPPAPSVGLIRQFWGRMTSMFGF